MKTDRKVIYNIRIRKARHGMWLAERLQHPKQYWKRLRKDVINTPGGPRLDSILRKNPDFEAVPAPSGWKVDWIPFNSKTDERLERWFPTENGARGFYMRLLRQSYPPKSQGIREAQRPV